MSAEDFSIVREALVNYGTWRMQKPRREKALVALDRLEARLAEDERELNRYQCAWNQGRYVFAEQLEAAEARLARLERIEGAAREYIDDRCFKRKLRAALAATEEGGER